MRREPPPDQLSAEPMVRVDALRRIDELVAQFGGDIAGLFARVQLDPALLSNRHAMFPLRTLAALFDRAATECACPDFVWRLAELQQGEGVLGPLDIAMRHSPTLGDAVSYCIDHFQAYSAGVLLCLTRDNADQTAAITCEVLLPPQPGIAAVAHHALLTIRGVCHRLLQPESPIIQLDAGDLTGELASKAGHRAALVLRFPASLLAARIVDIDPLIHALATDFVETRYPRPAQVLSARVRANIERFLEDGSATQARVAAALSMHSRTLQRRLKAEGVSFEAVRDSVRRERARALLTGSNLPLIRVARMLGYSEASILSRSCLRWFGQSPRSARGHRQLD